MKKIICYVIISLFVFVLFYILNPSYLHAQEEQKQVIGITPTDDAYVATDRYDPQDTHGFEKVNTGTLPFLKTWYAWNATTIGKQFIMTVVYLKFDLTNITSDKIESASLNLYPFTINLTNASRHVDVFSALNSDWNETKIVYQNAPHFYANGSSTLIVNTSDINKYVTSDVTQQVKSHAGSHLTLLLFFHLNYIHNEELIDFYSKDYADPLKRPKLELITTPETSIPGQTFPNSSGSTNTTVENSWYGYVISGMIGAAIGIGGFAVIKRMKKDNSTEQKSTSKKTMANLETTQNTVQSTQDTNVTCPSCKKPISADYKLCPYCGLGLAQTFTGSKESTPRQASKQEASISDSIQCQRCGKAILEGFKVCPYCGNVRDIHFPL